ncbi:MAG: hypothetical protein F6K55_02370 [Moorea sp. SIO4A3]|nr:hypothetical protein [Moorena sp. SIO4A3]
MHCCLITPKNPQISFLLFPAPCSLLPAPCSLLPAPCSLLPAPYSLFPVPYSKIIHNGNPYKVSDKNRIVTASLKSYHNNQRP